MALQSLTKLGRAVKCSICCSIITSLLLEPDEACLNLIHLMSYAQWVDLFTFTGWTSIPQRVPQLSNSMNPMFHSISMDSNCYGILSSMANFKFAGRLPLQLGSIGTEMPLIVPTEGHR